MAVVSLAEELEAAAAAGTRQAGEAETVAAVLPTEAEPGARVYLLAFHEGDGRTWLALDSGGEPVLDRARVRDAVSIAALCEVAGETAGGGDLDELLSQLVAVRISEAPPGIEDAEAAVLALQRTIGAAPQLATPERLDAIGAAVRELEQALDPAAGSAFAEAMKTAAPAVEALQREVESTYRLDLA